MWHVKTFNTQARMQKWIAKREHRIQFERVFVNTTPRQAAKGQDRCGILWRNLRIITFED